VDCCALISAEMNNVSIAMVWALGITPIYNTDSAPLSQA
jgi:hypothetical protein